ncbi:FlaD/FlaE family flagellar protein [Halodesulfurarchaeum sp. HSR-GB]|uniref:FlaD/FlaE family flagellar protein n=1 Tax=Halodesulfurarchaeum sp. HSR-GB TaxID=3074077 RepID=UPI002855C7DC|nr:flagella accessory protein C [Halodesulfurarchaeum sp. HSR-GB]MDR5656873.1 FlaD/FlaE family flagellar protein [Halodesulfurarchaeum sp. HSR-GB]
MVLVDLGPILPEFLSLGLVGVGLVSWLGDDGADDVETEGEAGEFAEDDSDFGMDEEFDVDGFDDDFGGMDGMDEGNGASSSELENRIEDLESEIANVSSTANTVRSENEQISEQVDDVEENVRKLLEIYEMVTRGVNPFVDDVSPDAGMGGSGDFGLFGGDEEESGAAEEEEDLESDIADAEAEDFFEDDAFDDFEEESSDATAETDDGDGFDDFEAGAFDEELGGEETEFDDFDDLEDGEDEAMTDDETDDSGGGTSFEELKAEYESGEADWAEETALETEEPTEAETDTTEPAAETTEDGTEEADLFQQDDLAAGEETVGVGAKSEPESTTDPSGPASEAVDAVDDTTAAGESVGDPQPDDEDEAAGEGGFQFGAATAADAADQPHLVDPPDGYLADVLLLEWLDYLVSEFDARNAIRAINHYERIGWIGEPMRDHCIGVLQGIADAEYPYRDESGPTDLTMEDHRRSLRYIEDLGTGHLDRAFGDRISTLKGDGIQR